MLHELFIAWLHVRTKHHRATPGWYCHHQQRQVTGISLILILDVIQWLLCVVPLQSLKCNDDRHWQLIVLMLFKVGDTDIVTPFWPLRVYINLVIPCMDLLAEWKGYYTLLFKSNGIFVFRWQNMVFIFKVHTWNFVCGIRRSFAFTMENILSVWYTATPGWTSKFGKVWKTRCQNAATRANIWRCFLVSWDDKYLWVMGSNNRHELYFCSK